MSFSTLYGILGRLWPATSVLAVSVAILLVIVHRHAQDFLERMKRHLECSSNVWGPCAPVSRNHRGEVWQEGVLAREIVWWVQRKLWERVVMTRWYLVGIADIVAVCVAITLIYMMRGFDVWTSLCFVVSMLVVRNCLRLAFLYRRQIINAEIETRKLTREQLDLFRVAPRAQSGAPVNSNPHRHCAGHRSAAEATIESYIKLCGSRPYYWYRTSRLAANGRAGWDYSYIDLSDARHEFERDCCIVVQDKDYLVTSLPVAPIVVYSFQPEDVAADRGEYLFCPVEGTVDTFHYSVVGGHTFQHKIRDYGGEFVDIPLDSMYYSPWYAGMIVRYQVKSYRFATDRAIILLNPVTVVEKDDSTPWSFLCFGNPPSLQIINGDGNYLSVGTSRQSYASERLTLVNHGHCVAYSGSTKIGVTSETIMTITDIKSRGGAHVVRAYFGECGRLSSRIMIPKQFAVVSYQFGDYVPTAKTPMVAFMSPIVDGAFVAARTLGNDINTIRTRVMHPGRSASEAVPMVYFRRADEFVDYFCGDEDLIPVQFDTIAEQQCKPNQLRLLHRADDGDMAELVVCFQKAEAYQTVNNPRNINQLPPSSKLRSAKYAYPFMAYMKRFSWYAFGRPPAEVATKVVSVLMSADVVSETDFSRWDGSRSGFLYAVCMRCFLQLFRRYGDVEEMKSIVVGDSHRNCVTEFRVRFKSGWMVLSGSMWTSAFNTLANTFINYCALARNMEPLAAMDKLDTGLIVGGDDGVSVARGQELLQVCEDLHIYIEQKEIQRGNVVTFLSRWFFPSAWEGEFHSTCDLRRQLAKLHVTTNTDPNILCTHKAYEKAVSIVSCDANTPIIGEWARAVIKLYKEYGDTNYKPNPDHMSWFSRITFLGENGWPNDIDSRMFEAALVYAGLDEHYFDFQQQIEQATEVIDLLEMRCLDSVPSNTGKPGAVVERDGDAVRVGEEENHVTSTVVEGTRDVVVEPTYKVEINAENIAPSLLPKGDAVLSPVVSPKFIKVPSPFSLSAENRHGRLGQLKMIKINARVMEFVLSHENITDLLYTGAYGPDSFPLMAQCVNSAKKVFMRAYDPMFMSNKFDDLRSNYVKIMEKRFTPKAWKQDFSTGVGDKKRMRSPEHLFFYDDSMVVPADQRSEEGRIKTHVKHFSMVVRQWIPVIRPAFVCLKVPRVALNVDLTLKDYECLHAYDDPVIEGRILGEKRVFAVARSNSTIEFAKLAYEPWPMSSDDECAQ